MPPRLPKRLIRTFVKDCLPPNERGEGNGAITLLFHIARSGRAVPDRERSSSTNPQNVTAAKQG